VSTAAAPRRSSKSRLPARPAEAVIAAAVIALALLVTPEFRVEQGVPPEVERQAVEGWTRLERLLEAEGLRGPASPRPIRIGLATSLGPGAAAASRPGAIALWPGLPTTGTGAGALRHELAHQLLFEVCPAASGDRLFHEAFAVAASGELQDWSAQESGHYLPLAKALEALGRGRSLNAPAARRALARLLAEAAAPPGRIPRALARSLTRCEAGAHWVALRPEDLAGGGAPAADALVILSRHSGDVIAAEGAASLLLPFGSTLKPFLLAGARKAPPLLAPSPSRPGWRCGDPLPAEMDATTALLRSCNGWFLDWASREPDVVRLGSWGPALIALGLSALPGDASEAIGIRPTLRISPLGLAQAYRLLAEARPDLMDALSRNAREGTLARLPASGALAGAATKTGTVLDASGNPRLGWIVAVDRDVVAVMVRAGMTPRSFASRVATVLERNREPARAAARVQVLGLVDTREVTARCAGKGFVASHGGPRQVPDEEVTIIDLARAGPLVCAGGPWLVRYPGLADARTYAGIFTYEPVPFLAPSKGPAPTPREEKARRGSDLVFRTTRLLYAAGVVASEDAVAHGEPRIALARVTDANEAHSRHPGRPVCDTTHCQVFRGTAPAAREDRVALTTPVRADSWLPFSRGGSEPWREERPAGAVEAALGSGARAIAFHAGRVSFIVSDGDGTDRWEERRELPCEALRGPLKLRSCPQRATVEGDHVVFEGRGLGHGEGLDVEWARRSGLSADEILARSYGRALRATP
jgi:hypothetical protein